VHFISIKPVLNDHLSYLTIFHCSLGRSHKTGLTVYKKQHRTNKDLLYWCTRQILSPGTLILTGGGYSQVINMYQYNMDV
jgi:hypothetical protein